MVTHGLAITDLGLLSLNNAQIFPADFQRTRYKKLALCLENNIFFIFKAQAGF